jgi:hypothetical protein
MIANKTNQDNTKILDVISGMLNKSYVVENDNVKLLKPAIEKLLKFWLNNFVLIKDDKSNNVNVEQKNKYSRQIYWFINKLMFISIHDESQDFIQIIKQILNKFIVTGFEVNHAFIRQFFAFLVTIINNAANRDQSKENLLLGKFNFTKFL